MTISTTIRRFAAAAAITALSLAAISAPPSASASASAASVQDRVRPVSDLSSRQAFETLEGEPAFVASGSDGQKVMRIDGSASGRIDLAKLGIDPRQYDVLKVRVKADHGPFVRLSLENYPEPGELSHWYILDGMREPFDWETIWIDLRRPEEIKAVGAYKGMSAEDPNMKGLLFTAHSTDTRRSIQQPGESIWLADLRFAKKAIDLDWDQRRFELAWPDDGDLSYTYPLVVTNRLDWPVTAELRLEPFQADHAVASLSRSTVELEPGESKTIEATVSLPADVAAEAQPLYAERFAVFASARGVEDSEVTIVRSADPIHLSVTVPIDEEKLRLPMFPRPSSLPDYVTEFDERHARAIAQAHSPAELIADLRSVGHISRANHYIETLVSAAYVFDYTGEEKFLDIAKALLEPLPEVWKAQAEKFERRAYQPIHYAMITDATLSLGWRLYGTQRSPYTYGGTGGNDASGGMQGVAYIFDILAPHLDDAFKQRFIHEFLLPAAIRARNHYIGPGNQQTTANVATLYGGLAARNWPLVSFAYSAEHGLLGNLKWGFDDDGLCIEGHYQSYSCRPILWSTELLHGLGIDHYDGRLRRILHSQAADAIGAAYDDPFRRFADEERFDAALLAQDAQTDGHHLDSATVLKWNGLEVAMNWGTHIMRGSHDRAALAVRTENHALRALSVGGGSYNHSSFGQSIIIVDEGLQNSQPAKVVSHDVVGPVQHVTAVSDEHYPAARIARTFALLGEHVLVIDRVAATDDRPHTFDWLLIAAGSKVSIPLTQHDGSWTDKADDTLHGTTFGGSIESHRAGRTDATWTEGDGRLIVLGAPNTRIFTWAGTRGGMMVRRENVKRTDFIALLSTRSASLERIEATMADGKPAQAVAVRFTLDDGRAYHALVNFEPPGVTVQAGPLTSQDRFATDYKP